MRLLQLVQHPFRICLNNLSLWYERTGYQFSLLKATASTSTVPIKISTPFNQYSPIKKSTVRSKQNSEDSPLRHFLNKNLHTFHTLLIDYGSIIYQITIQIDKPNAPHRNSNILGRFLYQSYHQYPSPRQ